MKELFEDIVDEVSFRLSNIRSFYYDFKYGIKNLIKWFPVIWGDRDWDFAFLFALLEKKFALYEKEWSTKAKFIADSKKQVKRFKICKEICRRLKDDWYYHENTFMFHDKKWGEFNIKESIDSSFRFSRKNTKSKEDIDLETKESLRLYIVENERKKADMELLQMYIRKYWNIWWW